MLRSLIRNEPLLRGTLSKLRSNGYKRCLSIAASRKFNNLRISTSTLGTKRAVVWTTNFVRNYADLPSHTKVTLPALSPTMEQGTIVSWEKKEGDKLNEGDLLAEIETDKATMGFETPEEGYLAKILIPAGQKDIKIGKLVCVIVENQEDVAAFKDYEDDAVQAAPSPSVSQSPTPIAAPVAAPPVTAAPASPQPMTAVEQKGARVYASPMAKKLAEAQQLRLEGRGTGIFGSIKSQDLAGMQSTMASPSVSTGQTVPQGGYIDIPVSNMRKVIAKRLLESKQTVPHYYVSVECQVDNLLKLREKVNKKYEKKGIRVSVNDFIIKAAATANRKVPEVNSYWMETAIRQFDNVDISVAVSTDSGLITPIVFSADRKGVVDISKEVKSLASKAKENKLQPNEFQGGTFTISNLGMFGITHICPVINPPQSAILGVGTTMKKLVIDPDNLKGFKEISVINVTLSADHRTVDGALAAQWLQYFREFIEDPETMLL